MRPYGIELVSQVGGCHGQELTMKFPLQFVEIVAASDRLFEISRSRAKGDYAVAVSEAIRDDGGGLPEVGAVPATEDRMANDRIFKVTFQRFFLTEGELLKGSSFFLRGPLDIITMREPLICGIVLLNRFFVPIVATANAEGSVFRF